MPRPLEVLTLAGSFWSAFQGGSSTSRESEGGSSERTTLHRNRRRTYQRQSELIVFGYQWPSEDKGTSRSPLPESGQPRKGLRASWQKEYEPAKRLVGSAITCPRQHPFRFPHWTPTAAIGRCWPCRGCLTLHSRIQEIIETLKLE